MESGERSSRTIMMIDDSRFQLEEGADLAGVRARIEAAVIAGGGFVDFAAAGSLPIAVLITPHSRVVIATEREIVADATVIEPPAGLYLLEDI
ncbi:MAG TPA: hypothetical protein DHW40_02380 [Microbacterium sp.]|nr:hypothetical protein [Microbacterium sp.]